MISPIFLQAPLIEIVLTTTLTITANAFLKSAEAQILEYLKADFWALQRRFNHQYQDTALKLP